MIKIHYSKDIDAIMLEIFDKKIDYALEAGNMVVHYTVEREPVLFEIFDAKNISFKMMDCVLYERDVEFA